MLIKHPPLTSKTNNTCFHEESQMESSKNTTKNLYCQLKFREIYIT